jgi:hypothetical protein
VLLIGLAALVVVAALVWLGLAIRRTWLTVKTFGREVAAAGQRVATASDALNTALDTANVGARRPAETA